MPLPMQKKETYTYADLLTWEDRCELIDGELYPASTLSEPHQRYELIDGVPYLMSSPSERHQAVSVALASQLYFFLEEKKCRVYPAPFDVRLFEESGDMPEDVTTTVQPDISVICDLSKLDKQGCKGAPDMIIEILSPSNRTHDRLTKRSLYQEAGVLEYWIVDPDAETVQVFLLDESGRYSAPVRYGREDAVPAAVLDGCVIDLKKVFRK